MSTNGHIFYEKTPNVFEGVGVNYDAYLTHLGSTLLTAYNEQSLVEKLISLGSLSSVDILCDIPPQYQTLSYKYREDYPPTILGYSLAYNRDYKEPMYPKIVVSSLDEIAKKYERPYIWKDNSWLYLDIETQIWKKVQDSLTLISEFDNNYIIPTKVWTVNYTKKEFFETINHGFLITQDNKFESGQYINFVVQDEEKPHIKYQLLVRIEQNYPHDAIVPGYRLLILSKPPNDLAWYSPILNPLELNK